MRRLALAAASIALSFASLPFLAPREIHAGGPFETKLSPDRQIVHSLNRLTFGPCPGDVENVRRIGLEKWIDLQLHPDRIPENPVLEARLEPLETLRMDPATVVRDYMQPQMQMATMSQPANVMNSLPQEERRKVMNGTAEERKAALESFDPEKRKQVLLTLPRPTWPASPNSRKKPTKPARSNRKNGNRK